VKGKSIFFILTGLMRVHPRLKFNYILPAGLIWIAALLFSASIVEAQEKSAPQTKPPAGIVASGGQFTLEKTVLAGGGLNKQTAPLTENATAGQTVAGLRSTAGQFSLYSGFWTPDNLSPTAAAAVVGGRILTAGGQGIRNVQVTITFPSGEIRSTVSSAFGYYRFAEIPVGHTYVVTISAKKYRFAIDSQVREVRDDLQDVDFIANGVS
jgi:hypothetical protein